MFTNRDNGIIHNEMEIDMAGSIQQPAFEEYYNSYEDIEVHRLLLSDNARISAYKEAILQNAHLFQGKVVMDVGAGTGILSLLMAQAGARKVYAIEASKMAKCIPAIIEANGYKDVIEVIHNEVEKVSLPPDVKMDVIVSEWMGFYLLHESMLSSVIYARDNFLAEGGVLFPSEARIYACPCAMDDIYNQEIKFWDNVHGFNFKHMKALVSKNKSKKPTIGNIKRSDLLSDPVCIKVFDINYITNEEIREFTCKNFVGIMKTGNYRGLCIWFDCDFNGIKYDNEGREKGTSITLSTSPIHPETHWKQTIISFARDSSNQADPTQNERCEADEYIVEEDEVVGWSIKFNQDTNNPRFYNMEVELLDAESDEHPIPCSCPMARCLIISKMLEKEEEDIETMEEDL